MHLHLSGYAVFHPAAEERAAAALSTARQRGCGISIDAASAAPLLEYGPERFLDAVSPVLLFANRDEAAVLTGTRDVEGAARALGQRCGEAIVKQGDGDAVWSDGERVVRVPGHDVTVIDSTGAGDAFAAGVLAARLAGADPDRALAAGHVLAARAIVRPGARP
jgi:sugar/nucleoside kinase (ribokinase family)